MTRITPKEIGSILWDGILDACIVTVFGRLFIKEVAHIVGIKKGHEDELKKFTNFATKLFFIFLIGKITAEIGFYVYYQTNPIAVRDQAIRRLMISLFPQLKS